MPRNTDNVIATIVTLHGEEFHVETFRVSLEGYAPADQGGLYDVVSDCGTPNHTQWDEVFAAHIATDKEQRRFRRLERKERTMDLPLSHVTHLHTVTDSYS